MQEINDFLNKLDSQRRNILEQSLDILDSNRSGLDSSLEVVPNILVVGSSEIAISFFNTLKQNYNATLLPYIESFSGYLGNFDVVYEGEKRSFSHIVFFLKFEIIKPQLGIIFANDYEGEEKLIEELDSLIGSFTYEKSILYFEDKCQYHHRNKNEFSYCHTCVDVCPNMAISKDDNLRELKFLDIDCIYCGLCVNVCPSGAMQKQSASLYAINKALKLYKDKIVLLLNLSDLENFGFDLAKKINSTNIFPFLLPNINILNEVYLLSIVQESAMGCILLGEAHPLLLDSINYVNSIYEKIFNKTPISLISDVNSLDSIHIEKLEGYSYEVEKSDFTRSIFSNRIQFFVKNKDFGIVPNTDSILYTNLDVNNDKCTLCMSCVEACNANALINSKDSFSLLFNPSFCTVCGYCMDLCPEGAIKMTLKGLELREKYFTYNTKLKDEPFRCVECGKVFASNRSITKVQSIMAPLFGGDEVKQRTLLCCSDCKVKIMFKA